MNRELVRELQFAHECLDNASLLTKDSYQIGEIKSIMAKVRALLPDPWKPEPTLEWIRTKTHD